MRSGEAGLVSVRRAHCGPVKPASAIACNRSFWHFKAATCGLAINSVQAVEVSCCGASGATFGGNVNGIHTGVKGNLLFRLS